MKLKFYTAYHIIAAMHLPYLSSHSMWRTTPPPWVSNHSPERLVWNTGSIMTPREEITTYDVGFLLSPKAMCWKCYLSLSPLSIMVNSCPPPVSCPKNTLWLEMNLCCFFKTHRISGQWRRHSVQSKELLQGGPFQDFDYQVSINPGNSRQQQQDMCAWSLLVSLTKKIHSCPLSICPLSEMNFGCVNSPPPGQLVRDKCQCSLDSWRQHGTHLVFPM